MHVFIPLAPAPCLSVELSQALSPMRLESSGRHSVSSSASEMSAKSLWPHLDRDRIRTRSRYTRTELRPDIKIALERLRCLSEPFARWRLIYV